MTAFICLRYWGWSVWFHTGLVVQWEAAWRPEVGAGLSSQMTRTGSNWMLEVAEGAIHSSEWYLHDRYTCVCVFTEPKETKSQ